MDQLSDLSGPFLGISNSFGERVYIAAACSYKNDVKFGVTATDDVRLYFLPKRNLDGDSVWSTIKPRNTRLVPFRSAPPCTYAGWYFRTARQIHEIFHRLGNDIVKSRCRYLLTTTFLRMDQGQLALTEAGCNEVRRLRP